MGDTPMQHRLRDGESQANESLNFFLRHSGGMCKSTTRFVSEIAALMDEIIAVETVVIDEVCAANRCEVTSSLSARLYTHAVVSRGDVRLS